MFRQHSLFPPIHPRVVPVDMSKSSAPLHFPPLLASRPLLGSTTPSDRPARPPPRAGAARRRRSPSNAVYQALEGSISPVPDCPLIPKFIAPPYMYDRRDMLLNSCLVQVAAQALLLGGAFGGAGRQIGGSPRMGFGAPGVRSEERYDERGDVSSPRTIFIQLPRGVGLFAHVMQRKATRSVWPRSRMRPIRRRLVHHLASCSHGSFPGLMLPTPTLILL